MRISRMDSGQGGLILVYWLCIFQVVWSCGTNFYLSHDPNDVHFYLYPNSEDTDYNEEILFNDTASLLNSSFNPNLRTVFIVHGFRFNVNSEMPQLVKNAYLESGRHENYIICSWGALSTPVPNPPELSEIMYYWVVQNVPIVAQRLTDFINFLMKENYTSLPKIDMVGHSLGAHISGISGYHLQNKFMSNVSRITGLDPAGPGFYPREASRGIVPTDADFIDIIHTNAGVIGDTTRDGHVDFWINGGSTQPGCAYNDTEIIGFRGVCSHRYSYKVWAASFTEDFKACKCSRFLNNIELELCLQDCSDEIPRMGVNTPPTATGDYYVVITTNPP